MLYYNQGVLIRLPYQLYTDSKKSVLPWQVLRCQSSFEDLIFRESLILANFGKKCNNLALADTPFEGDLIGGAIPGRSSQGGTFNPPLQPPAITALVCALVPLVHLVHLVQ